MKKIFFYIIFLALATVTVSNAQNVSVPSMVGTYHSNHVGTVYPLDAYPGTNQVDAVAFAQLTSTATLSCKVRRASDNVSMDIGFYNGDFDVTTAQAFAGASDLYVEGYYGQLTGTYYDNSTATEQIKVVFGVTPLSSTGKTVGYTDGHRYYQTPIVVNNASMTIFVSEYDTQGGGGGGCVAGETGNGTDYQFLNFMYYNIYYLWGNGTSSFDQVDITGLAASNHYVALANSSTDHTVYKGTNYKSNNAGAGYSSNVTIRFGSAVSQPLVGYFDCLIIFSSPQTGTEITNIQNWKHAYYGN